MSATCGCNYFDIKWPMQTIKVPSKIVEDNTLISVPHLFGEKQGDMVFMLPLIVGTLCAQLLLKFLTNIF